MIRNTNNIKLTKKIDYLSLSMFLFLVLFGWLNIFSCTHFDEELNIFKFSHAYIKQLYWILLALVLSFLILNTDSKYFVITAYLIYFLILSLNIATLIIGKEINNQKAWIIIGELRIQPSEFLKIATSLALAKLLSQHNFKLRKFKNLIFISLIIGIPVIVILFQKDTGTALIFSSFIFVLYREGLNKYVLYLFISAIFLFLISLLVEFIIINIFVFLIFALIYIYFNFNLKHLYFILLLVLVVIFVNIYSSNIINFFDIKISRNTFIFFWNITLSLILIFIALQKKIKSLPILCIYYILTISIIFSVNFVYNKVLLPHQKDRIDILLGKKFDIKGSGYNIHQSLIAIGSGGFFGKGFMKGTQTKFNFVPEQTTDFIFCTIGEEWGFIGSFIFLIIYVGFIFRLIYIAEQQRGTFSRVFGYSLVSLLMMHFIINIGMTIGLVPVIGIPLPFISYGGSSLWAFSIFLFMFLKFDMDKYKYLT
ncbi:MAG: rod shape-determining protein RodA [Bacteroidales bacterium]|nr:rod shape-determining protein RodA [Bacteroidales bacterium]